MLIPITALSACSTPAERVSYTPRVLDKPNLILPEINTLDLNNVDFIVINRDNAEEVFAELERSGKAIVVFALDENGYQNLSLNMAQILEVISQQGAVIAAYENYYVNTNTAIDNFNNNR